MATSKRNAQIRTVVDTLTTEAGWTEDFPIQGGLHIYDGKLKYHDGGQIKEVATSDQVGGVGTTTTVNISSAQILSMGTSPIELLPAPGANKYYDIEKIILEPTEGLTPYTNNEDIYVTDGSTVGYTNRYALGTQPSIIRNFSQFVRTESYWGGDVVVSDQLQINQPITMTTDGGTNPTLGDGTLRAIITYTVRTFGA